MAKITLTGTPADTCGDIPAIGSKAPDFTLVKTNLADARLSDYAGRTLVLNVVLSVDTDTCPITVRKCEELAAARPDVSILTVSCDLPFAQGRYLRSSGLKKTEAASCFRDGSFARNYGVLMVNGPLNGMLARAAFVVDGQGIVRFSQLVREINDEPDYAGIVSVLDRKPNH